jgi:hypothetical protein
MPGETPRKRYAGARHRGANSRSQRLLAFLGERFGFPPPWDRALAEHFQWQTE